MGKSKKVGFNVEKYLQTAGLARKVLEYRKRQTIFAQGSACKSVLYLQRGRVKLTVIFGSPRLKAARSSSCKAGAIAHLAEAGAYTPR